MSGNFTTIVVADFEYEVSDGDLPVPLCMVAHVLNERLERVDTIKLWRGEFGKVPPFDIGPDTLFCGYSCWAEMTCFKVLGWKFPTHIFDQHTAYLAASNILLPHNPDEKRTKLRKRLSDACQRYGLEGWANMDKGDIAQSIGDGTWREKYSPSEVMAYCEEDVRMEVRLLRAQLRGHGRHLLPADPELVIDWSNYSAKAIALIQARGVPIDTETWGLIQEHKFAVIEELRRRFDPSYLDDDPIYNAAGEWSYGRFERWLAGQNVPAWPRLPSGQLDTKGDAFRLMSHVPGIAGLHILKDSVNFIRRPSMPVGRDGRNRASLFPFGTATGRNAHSKSVFNAHAGLRSLMTFAPDRIGAYLDYRTQEVGIAAALSDDEALKRDYNGGDIYHALALMCGLTAEPNPAQWKKQPGSAEVRQRMKQLQLGISYGMGVASLARGLDRHPLIASHIIETHKRSYPDFWAWRANMVEVAMSSSRRLESQSGWPLRISSSPNERTLFNFPMQSAGADVLRLAVVRLCEAGIVPVMLVHDGILFEETDGDKIGHAKEIMRKAGQNVCGFEIGVDVDQNKELHGGIRYQDKRPAALKMWATVMDTLQTVGAIERKVA